MANERYLSSITAFICSIIPIGIALGLIGLVDLVSADIFRPGKWGDFGGLLYGPLRLCVATPIALMTIPLAVYSVFLGVAAMREPEAKGKPLAGTAIVLGILEIVIGTGYVFHLWSF